MQASMECAGSNERRSSDTWVMVLQDVQRLQRHAHGRRVAARVPHEIDRPGLRAGGGSGARCVCTREGARRRGLPRLLGVSACSPPTRARPPTRLTILPSPGRTGMGGGVGGAQGVRFRRCADRFTRALPPPEPATAHPRSPRSPLSASLQAASRVYTSQRMRSLGSPLNTSSLLGEGGGGVQRQAGRGSRGGPRRAVEHEGPALPRPCPPASPRAHQHHWPPVAVALLQHEQLAARALVLDIIKRDGLGPGGWRVGVRERVCAPRPPDPSPPSRSLVLCPPLERLCEHARGAMHVPAACTQIPQAGGARTERAQRGRGLRASGGRAEWRVGGGWARRRGSWGPRSRLHHPPSRCARSLVCSRVPARWLELHKHAALISHLRQLRHSGCQGLHLGLLLGREVCRVPRHLWGRHRARWAHPPTAQLAQSRAGPCPSSSIPTV